MRKLALFILAIALTTFAAEETMFGFRSGLNISSLSQESSEVPLNGKNLTGFQFGALADFNLIGILYFQPGMMFVSKGGIIVISFSQYGRDSDEITYKSYYLEWPLMFAIKAPISDNASIVVNAGPYASAGLFGKVKRIKYENAENVSEDGQKGLFSKDAFKRFDWGVGFGGGFDLKSLYVGLNYDLGLNKISRGNHRYGSVYNRTLSLVADSKF